MQQAIGKEISKPGFLKAGHLSLELLVHIVLLFVKIPREKNSPCLRVIFDCFIVLGISGFKISHMKKLPGRKEEPGDLRIYYLVALNFIILGFSYVSMAFGVPF